MSALNFPTPLAARRRQNEAPELGMVTGIRAGVVLLNVSRGVSDTANGSPEETAKMGNEVRRHVSDGRVQLFGFEDQRPERHSPVIQRGFQARF
jgi:hypothetical protein